MPQPEVTQQTVLPARNYNLQATLTSGQAFRWQATPSGWEGVIGQNWVRLAQHEDGIHAETTARSTDWNWLRSYLQTDIDLEPILQSFPKDSPMQRSVAACPGLRLLRQDPWECLASFILSSTKQIVQIRQIVNLICQRFGARLPAPRTSAPVNAFPSPDSIANATEQALRDCRMGFRAPNLLNTARLVVDNKVTLARLHQLDIPQARAELLQCPGVGQKIADCVLLFACGFQSAFPVDVWISKALTRLYFPNRRPTRARLERFLATHFGPNAGYAQQYLFHFARKTL